MIDLIFAENNINKYKFDYSGYLVIVDKIRTADALNSTDLRSMQNHLNDLEKKYENELNVIRRLEKKPKNKKRNIFKLTYNQVVDELKYISQRLPAIGFIMLGRGKEIGIDVYVAKTTN